MSVTDRLDSHVAARIRLTRIQADISQERLALALEIPVQQLRQIEAGRIRLSAGQAWLAARELGLPSVDDLYLGAAS